MAKPFSAIAFALRAIQPEPQRHPMALRPYKTQHSQCSPWRIPAKVNVALGQSALRPRNWWASKPRVRAGRKGRYREGSEVRLDSGSRPRLWLRLVESRANATSGDPSQRTPRCRIAMSWAEPTEASRTLGGLPIDESPPWSSLSRCDQSIHAGAVRGSYGDLAPHVGSQSKDTAGNSSARSVACEERTQATYSPKRRYCSHTARCFR